MPEQTKEWKMVVELHKVLDDLTTNAQDFIESLYDNLDPYMAFLEQVEGAGVEQERWLFSLYAKHIELDDEAAREIYDEYGEY